jgi:quinol-cytochrome oxidoreductase complex cytochrome b subunit
MSNLLTGAVINLNHPGYYLHWGILLISMANLLVIVIMIALFVVALLVPFVRIKEVPAARAQVGPAGNGADHHDGAGDDPDLRTWTGGVRRWGLRHLPPDKLLPDAQPAYVASWVYIFGVLTVGALVVVVASGSALAVYGPAWWHTSFAGHFVNSLHLWSVELFMGFMVIHLWAKYWMAAWRGGRSFTWMTGVICFLVAIFEGFTGYVSQTNFDSQWIAFEAKDGLNSGGIGAYFNTMNFGQALTVHIVLLPLALVLLVALHVLLVRVHGVVPPIDANAEHLGAGGGGDREILLEDTGRPVAPPPVPAVATMTPTGSEG